MGYRRPENMLDAILYDMTCLHYRMYGGKPPPKRPPPLIVEEDEEDA